MFRKFAYSLVLFAMIFGLLIPVTQAVDVANIIKLLTLDREELVTIKAVNEKHASDYRSIKEWYDQEAAMFDATLQASKSLYDYYDQQLTGAHVSSGLALYDLNIAIDMLMQLSGGSTSDPAIQHWISKRDDARQRYKDAQSEIFRLEPLVSSARIRYNRDKSIMRNLLGWRDYAASWETLHTIYAEEAQRRIDEIDAELRKYGL